MAAATAILGYTKFITNAFIITKKPLHFLTSLTMSVTINYS